MHPHGEIPEFRRRYRYMVGFVGITFALLLGRLCQMQVVRGEDYLQQAEENFIQEQRIPTVRGTVTDRRGRRLVGNRPAFDVYVTPRFASPTSLDRLARKLGLTVEQATKLRQSIAGALDARRMRPQLAARDISRDQLASLEMDMSELDGVSVVSRAHRSYLRGSLAAHVLGYMNEVTAEELQRDHAGTYALGDLVGRFGVERMYESHLRGVPGRQRVVVDARGHLKRGPEAAKLLKGETRVEPQPGHNLVLTIDMEVQQLVERALRNYESAAAVVLEVNTGRILASASKPTFAPNVLTGRLNLEEARRLATDERRPLMDKVYRENYYPGSTYKVIPAIAALEQKTVDPGQKVTCKGAHSFGRRSFRCSHSHGKVNLHEAIVQSCNVYFYTLGEMVGMDMMAHYARLFGLGAPTGVGLNGEVAGFIATKDWYVQRKQPFRVGFTLNAAIGQGNTKATPIQIASLYAAIANGGTLYLPQIVERIETGAGLVIQRFTPRVRRRIEVSPRTLAIVRSALNGVVDEEKGTAHGARIEGVSVAGKTGTAQVSRRVSNGETIILPDHSWFAAYAPTDDPQIALAVIIEHGGKAAKVAAPVAMEIVNGYFKYVAPTTAGGAPSRSAAARGQP